MSILWNPDMEAEKQQYVTIYFEWCSNCWTCTWVI
jgi:spore coat polysaccharide biosynthesis protein SpsF (cytidylyltransferase family)